MRLTKGLIAAALSTAGSSAAISTRDRLRGVDPRHASRYELGSGDTFTCLDGSLSIPGSRINDDYCDCPDGSDEPGTSACGVLGSFYCANAGHVPVTIPSTFVNDGTCEAACCDGSDEWAGLVDCPNTCAEQAREHAKVEAAKEKVRRAGYAVKQSWIAKAATKRQEVEREIANKEKTLDAHKHKLAQLQAELDALQAEELEKGAPARPAVAAAQADVDAALADFNAALASLRGRVAQQQKRVEELTSIMADLAGSYNPNYQDMAVKGAVAAFDELPELPDFLETETAQLLGNRRVEVTCPAPEQPAGPEPSMLELLLANVRARLVDFGILQAPAAPFVAHTGPRESGGESAALTEKRNAQTSQQYEVDAATRQLGELRDDLARGAEHYGEGEMYRAVKGECFESRIGEYDYEVCLHQSLAQKSANSGSTSVGVFSRIDSNGDLLFENGARCWNGPERSGRVTLECGDRNELVSVREAQKCEYVLHVKSPAACGPPQRAAGHDEL